jgi:Aegerolysin
MSPLENPYNETVSAQGTKIEGKTQFEWGHCGRASSPTGTEGSFEVHLASSGEMIAEIYWDCPWGGSTKIEKHFVKAGYLIAVEGFSFPSGPLGKGTISIVED